MKAATNTAAKTPATPWQAAAGPKGGREPAAINPLWRALSLGARPKLAVSSAGDLAEADRIAGRATDVPGAITGSVGFARISIMPPPAQRKPAINSPGDPYEREADEVADKVMRTAEPAPIGSAPAALQRKCATCEDEEKNSIQTQRTPSGDSSAGLDAGTAVHAAGQGGAPLSRGARSYFEPRFGHDFSRVRVHADGAAATAARAVQARAYTFGRDIVFGAGEYAPATVQGKRLLAHELVHVVQQGAAATRQRSGVQEVRRQIQRQSLPKAGASCETVCLSMASMRRAVEGVCRLAGEDDTRCTTNRTKLAESEKRIADANCKCAITPTPAPACVTPYAKATSFQALIDLVRVAETRLRAAGITSAKDQIHALRGIYYGTTWSLDYSVEKDTTRNEGFQRFTRPSENPSKSVPPDVQTSLDCGLFKALQDSQDLIDPSGRQVDFGHLIIALDARNDPAFASNIKYPVATPLLTININLGGTGTELVTWIGDLGGGAGSLAVKRVSAPGTSAKTVFTGSDYGGSINLEGDVAGSVVATASPSAVTAPSFAPGKGLSDALQDYLSPAAPSAAWNKRATTFLTMNGATFDASGALTNRAALIAAFASKILEFACNYLASRVKGKRITVAEAKAAAASHVVSSSQEVATAFVDALVDSHKSGGKIEATRFPSPTTGGSSACTTQLLAIKFLGP